MAGPAFDVRAARRDDCAAMREIYNHYVLHDTCTYQTDPETLEERLAWFDRHGTEHPVFVAEAEGRVVGWASLSHYNSRCGYRLTVEDSVYLDPHWRGRGLGTALLRQLVASAAALGHHTIIAGISAEQAPSVALHARLGFVTAGRLAQVGYKFEQWLDVIYMQLTLPSRPDEVTVARETPRQPEVAELIRQLDAYCAALYPAESNHFLDIEALCAPEIRFFVARRGSEALGCGALRVDGEGYGEVKRMFVLPRARGLKLGKRILTRLESQARLDGLSALRLETGIHQPEALGLYRRLGFVGRGPFGAYAPDPLSVFMEKTLG